MSPSPHSLLMSPPMEEFSLPVSPPMGECQMWGKGGDDSTLLFTPNSHCFLRPPVALNLLYFHKLFLFLTYRVNFNQRALKMK